MAVLAEAISVIVRRDAIDRRYPGGWGRFLRDVPNRSMCTDGELVRVGFMHPQDASGYASGLQGSGLAYLPEQGVLDFLVVDQQTGPAVPCGWIEFAELPFAPGGPEAKVSACWLFEEPRMTVGIHLSGRSFDLAVPRSWEYDGSISQRATRVLPEDEGRRLKFLRNEDGEDVFLDVDTGKEVYQSRVRQKEG